MKLRTLAVCLLFSGVCSAKEHDYQQGILVRRESTSCLSQEKGSKTVTAVELGSGPKRSRGLICQEYTLQSDHMIFRIRQADQKHPLVLPVGEVAQFRIGKQKLMVRVPEVSDKEHAYIVVSFSPREDNISAAMPKQAQSEAAHQSASRN